MCYVIFPANSPGVPLCGDGAMKAKEKVMLLLLE
jgi:hypothetical protein